MLQRVEIVPAAETDLAVLAEIARCSFPDPWSDVVFQQTWKEKNSIFWCARLHEAVCGYLVLSWAGEAISVDDLAVHPAYRRQGIGRQLLTWAFWQNPGRIFWLEVRQSNAAAIALYQSMGFVQTGFRKRYYQNPEEGAVLLEAKSPK